MIIASNFKTNHTRKSTYEFISFVDEYVNKNNEIDVLVFPTATSLDSFETNEKVIIGTQNAYPVEKGSFTGEIGTSQLDEFGIKTILIGHSERRHILGESQEEIARKYQYFKDLNYKIVYCVGEPLEVKEQGLEATLEYIYAQLDGIDTNYEDLIIAYEPVWAIGTGVTATNEDIESIHKVLKQKIDKPLLYGGSVKVENVASICSLNSVDGALIGTASWVKEDFVQILKNVKEVL